MRMCSSMACGAERVDRVGSPARSTRRRTRSTSRRLQQAALARHRRRHHETRAHRLAVQPRRIGGGGLDRVPERVPEVQQRAFPVFALVAADDLRLDLAGAADDVCQRSRVARQQRLEVRLEPGKQRRIADEAVLDDLRKPGAQLARRAASRARWCR